jgi:hypothetical protein
MFAELPISKTFHAPVDGFTIGVLKDLELFLGQITERVKILQVFAYSPCLATANFPGSISYGPRIDYRHFYGVFVSTCQKSLVS